MSAKNGHTEWWLNRKSRIGLAPAARPPPHLPSGEPWWTQPPTSAPEPEFLEYVMSYRRQLIAEMAGARRQRSKEIAALLSHVNDWITEARRLLHERVQAPDRADLHTTDGLLVAASRQMNRMRILIVGLGGQVDEEVAATMQAVQARADEVRRRRATDAACPRPATKAPL
jgi:hypothetical protein